MSASRKRLRTSTLITSKPNTRLRATSNKAATTVATPSSPPPPPPTSNGFETTADDDVEEGTAADDDIAVDIDEDEDGAMSFAVDDEPLTEETMQRVKERSENGGDDDSADEDELHDDDAVDDDIAVDTNAGQEVAAGDGQSLFGSTLAALLSQPVPAAILSSASTKLARVKTTTDAQVRAAKQHRLERQRWREADHHSAQMNEVEKKYKRIATKATVQLFNALTKQQALLKAQSTGAIITPANISLSSNTKTAESVANELNGLNRQSFLQQIKNNHNSTQLSSNNTIDGLSINGAEHLVDDAATSKWSVLRDDFLHQRTSRLSDWDQQLDDDDIDNELEDEEEEEREEDEAEQ